ncbi:hypothetical protein PENSPDRAFT_52438 [Peniophora sp. CONT]|nr:hypothetical protein PENSPDRAFT_52438 [Peniophora sp. CONT]
MPFPLFMISLRTGFRYQPLTFLRLEGYWDMWVLRPRASHLPPTYPPVSDVQIGFIDAELSVEGNFGPRIRSLEPTELRCITEVELCVHVAEIWTPTAGIHSLLYALPNVTTCWITQGREEVNDPDAKCIDILSYLSTECDDLMKATPTRSVQTPYPFPRLRILGIKGIKITSEDVLVKLLQTLTLRSERDCPILHMLSLPSFRRPREGGLNNMSGVAANIECLTETVHWGRGSDEGSDDDSDGTSSTDDQSEERDGDEDEGC